MKRSVLLLLILILSTSVVFSYPRKVLLELGTSVDCVICPSAHSVIENQVLPLYPQTVVMAIHVNENTPTSYDPFAHFHGEGIRELINSGYMNFPTPGHWIDRCNFWCVSYSNLLDSVTYRYTSSPTTPLRIQVISKNYNQVSRQLNMTVDMNSEQTLSGVYYFVFSILEDNLIYRQMGASENYVHKWVVRNIVNGARGDTLVNGVWPQGSTYRKNISAVLDTGWIPGNCRYALYVYKSAYPDTMLAHAEIFQAETGSVTGSVGILENTQTAGKYYLEQNYPNPFNPFTRIKFAVSERGPVSLAVFDITGRMIEKIYDGTLNAGEYNAEFDGSRLSGGIYFYALKTKRGIETRKMILLK